MTDRDWVWAVVTIVSLPVGTAVDAASSIPLTMPHAGDER
jgi:hypothetical protein